MASSTNEHSASRSKSADPTKASSRRRTDDRLQGDARSLTNPARRTNTPSRFNKLYRCPPTPPPEVQYNRERNFVLDSKAVSHISNDYSTANPKLGSVIPPYNAQTDSSVDVYFDFFGVRRTLEKTGQVFNITALRNIDYDQFFLSFSQLLMNLLQAEYMIDFIQLVMVIDICHCEINLVLVKLN